MNGGGYDVDGGPSTPTSRAMPRNYKLIVDPFLVKGANKLYRYDGIIPDDPTHPPVIPRDPRPPIARVLRTRLEPQELQVPRFVYHTMQTFEPKLIFSIFQVQD